MSNLWGERLGGLGAILFGAYMASLARNFPVGGHMFPVFAAGSIVLIGAAMIVLSFLKPQTYSREIWPELELGTLKPIVFTLITIGYFILIFRLGYFVSTLLFLLTTPLLLGLRRYGMILATTVLSVAFIYSIFELALNARLPAGLLL